MLRRNFYTKGALLRAGDTRVPSPQQYTCGKQDFNFNCVSSEDCASKKFPIALKTDTTGDFKFLNTFYTFISNLNCFKTLHTFNDFVFVLDNKILKVFETNEKLYSVLKDGADNSYFTKTQKL